MFLTRRMSSRGRSRPIEKGDSAKKFFDAANAVDVYHDNCPHFIRLVDWLTGTASATIGVPEAIQAQMTAFQVEYDALTANIEQALKSGENLKAGLLKTEQKYLAMKMVDVVMPPDENA
jgi:hypothetical protein